MSDKYCCVVWEALALELAETKRTELNQLVTDKGIPKSVFASVFKVLEGMLNACPVCRSPLKPELFANLKEQHRTSVEQVTNETNENPSYTVKGKCSRCGGQGILGIDKNGVKIKCMACHGQGVFTSAQIAQDPKAGHAQGKVDDIRTKLGISGTPVNVTEKE